MAYEFDPLWSLTRMFVISG